MKSQLKTRSLQTNNETTIKDYLQKNEKILKEEPLKKSKYTDITKLNRILKTIKIGKAKVVLEPKDAAKIYETESTKSEDIKETITKTITLEKTPKDQYEAKANMGIEKATIIKIKEKAKLKIKTLENTYNKIIIEIPKNKEILIVIEHELEKNSVLAETILCEENSNITYVEKNFIRKEAILTNQFIVEKNSTITKSDFTTNGELFRANTTIILKGEGAEAKFYSSLLGEKESKYDINYIALHDNNNTKSHCIFKSVAKDQSKNVFDGMIKITEKGRMTNALLECHGMIIGKQASTNQIPSLEISNDEVKATHSATIAHIEDEEIFYLQSRGLNIENARNLIIKSFLESNAMLLPETARKEIIEEIEKKA